MESFLIYSILEQFQNSVKVLIWEKISTQGGNSYWSRVLAKKARAADRIAGG